MSSKKKLPSLPTFIQSLEAQGLEEKIIAESLIHSSINRRLEISEVEWLLTYVGGLDIKPVAKLQECKPCRNIDDLLYRLLELPSENEITSYAKKYIKNMDTEQDRRTTESTIWDLYYYIVGKFNNLNNKTNEQNKES